MLYRKASELTVTPIEHCMGGQGTVQMERLLDAPAVSQCLEEELPWHRYPTPTEGQIAADPRLSEPIFQIEDVTGA